MTTIFENALNDIPAYAQEQAVLSLDIVDRIQQILDRQGLSHEELAKMLGESASGINNWMRGSHNFTLENIARIHVALVERILL